MHPMLLSWLHYPKCGSLCCGLNVAGAILLKDHGYIEFASDHFPGGKQLFPNYIIPIAIMLGLSFLLVLIVKRIWGANTREWMIAIFTGFVSVYLVLTVVGTSMRGPGMDLFTPWSVPQTHQCYAPSE